MDPEYNQDAIARLKQHPLSIWLTGLSGSGKTTLASKLYHIFHVDGLEMKILDGDRLRLGINRNLGFSIDDRKENIRRAAEISKLFNEFNVCTINAFICPTRNLREMAQNIVGNEQYVEIFLNASLEACENRDTKGLYARCRRGEIAEFTGITSPFEIPESPHFIVDTVSESPDESARRVFEFICSYICRIKR